jgi:bifunctional non-homologous end joining protein LigD
LGDRFPLIVAGALRLPENAFRDRWRGCRSQRGWDLSNFDALPSRRHDKRAQFYAFDLLSGDCEDLRKLPLSIPKAGLPQLPSDPVDGIFLRLD